MIHGEPSGRHRPLALVTGVGREIGLGAAIARELARQGWDLALGYWGDYDERVHGEESGGSLTSVISEVEALGASVAAFNVDIAVPDEPARLLHDAGRTFGRPVQAMVLSHAESVDSSILDTDLDSFDRHFAVNARAAWLLLRAFSEQFPSELNGSGRVLALTSDHTVHNLPYGASKGALDRIVLAAARELGHQGISANVLNPGPVDTGWMDRATHEALAARHPGGRLGTPAQVALVAAFLLSGPGGWINGQLIKADGGFSA